jgi:hypothetical protein
VQPQAPGQLAARRDRALAWCQTQADH